MLGDFVKKQEVLEFIEERTREKMDTSSPTLERAFWLTPSAACSHLKRLWRERLIRSTEYPWSYRQGLGPGESIRDHSFRISRRGLERLKRWKEKKKEKDRKDRWF